jgi:hypothetical protein
MRFNNGVPADQLVCAAWRKSQVSNPSGSCVEVAGFLTVRSRSAIPGILPDQR